MTAQVHAHDAELIAALATGATHTAAAERAGVSLSTVNRRVADPAFRLQLIEAVNDRRDSLLLASVSTSLRATTWLAEVMLGRVEGATMTHRVRAAIALKGSVVLADREGRV